MKTMKWIIVVGLTALGLLACNSAQNYHAHEVSTAEGPERITIDQVLAKLEKNEEVIFLDSRNDTAWGQATTVIPGAIRVGNNDQLKQLIQVLPKDRFIVTYCT